ATSQGTVSFNITGTGKHRITVFLPGKIESSSEGATMPNTNRKFVYRRMVKSNTGRREVQIGIQ
ncbi:MAG: hypothetical protein B5M53_02415, partial [Candidatus Cloacimonas sp. 4484_209]